MSAARLASVRGARPRRIRPAIRAMVAKGMSQEIWPPMISLNSRWTPALPPKLAPLPAEPTEELAPKIRPKPL